MSTCDYLISREKYSILPGDETFSVLSGDEPLFTFQVRSQIHSTAGADADRDGRLRRVITSDAHCTTVTWQACGTLWQRKDYVLECRKDSFRYYVRIYGTGNITTIRYFTGMGSVVGSDYEVCRYFIPEAAPGSQERIRYCGTDHTVRMHYFAPPMYCLPFQPEGSPRWCGIGLAAKTGAHNFDELRFKFVSGRFYPETELYGYTHAEGVWESPAILGTFGMSPEGALSEYRLRYLPDGHTLTSQQELRRWWYGPLFCGWGEQCRLAKGSGKQFDLARQDVYMDMTRRLEELDLKPTAVIIDDKWQSQYGTAAPDPAKWPDLRRFAEKQHEAGRKVLLWFKVWNNEGLPADECVEQLCLPIAADPTNPKYQARLREIIRRLLSAEEGCCNCDGFKLDFANCMPLGENLRLYENGVYGVELLHRMYSLFYRYSKEAKGDALINCSACHPYFADISDEARLHDYDAVLRCETSVMTFRRDMYRCAMGERLLIDTDGCNFSHVRDAMRYMRSQSALGVPDLYALPDDLGEDNWSLIRNAWEAYSRSVDERFADADKVLENLLPPETLTRGIDFSKLTKSGTASLSVITKPTPGCGFLHEAAGISFHGVEYAAWYNCPQRELCGNTPIRFVKSTDGGRTWTKPQIVAEDPTGKILFCPPVFGISEGRLYLMLNEMVSPDHIHSLDLYVLDEEAGKFDLLWRRPIPFKLNTNAIELANGKLMLAGRMAEPDGFPNTPAVLISDSGRMDADWRIVYIAPNGTLPDGTDLIHPEICPIVRGSEITMFCRNDLRNVPLLWKSHDFGETWEGPFRTDIPFSGSKIYAGTLSNGISWVCGNLQPDRKKLMLLWTEPGGTLFTRAAILCDGNDDPIGLSVASHYPVGWESGGVLRLIFTTSYDWSRRGASLATIRLI